MAASRLLLGFVCISVCCWLNSAATSTFDLDEECPHILSLSSLKTSPPPNTTLRVMVPWKVGFEQFVKFRSESCLIDGFSVQVFLTALRYMRGPRRPRFQFVLYGEGDATPIYNDMVEMVQNKTVDVAVADLTINKDRMEKVGFTVPYLASSLGMVTPFRYGSASTWLDLLKPFSWRLWLALLGSFLVTGIALYVLENKNPDFHMTVKKRGGRDEGSSRGGSAAQGHAQTPGDSVAPHLVSEDASTNVELADQVSEDNPPQMSPLQEGRNGPPAHAIPSAVASHKRRITNAYWFASLCVFQAQQESVRTHLGRTVTIIWLFVMLIFNSSYTASLASLLSAQKVLPTISSFDALQKDSNISVGYQAGSFMDHYMAKIQLQNHSKQNLSSETAYAQALLKTNGNPGVGAILDELPYIEILLHSECDLTKVSDDNNKLPYFGGFGFAFQKGDPLIDEFSKMILQMKEDGTLQVLKDGWKVGNANRNGCADREPSHLSLSSAGGLLAIIGSVYIFCSIWRICTKLIKASENSCNLPMLQNSQICRQTSSMKRNSNRVHDGSQHDQTSE